MNDVIPSSNNLPVAGPFDPSKLTSEELTDQIDRHHAEVRKAMARGVYHAIIVGECLAEQKRKIPHGEWGIYLLDRRMTPRMSQRYMQYAKHKAKLLQMGNGDLRHVSQAKALKLIQGDSRPKAKAKATPKPRSLFGRLWRH